MTIDLFIEILVAFSGLAWTIVYLESIRLGFKQKTYAIPFWALALNLAWEGSHAVIGYIEKGITLQIIVNTIWFVFDIAILYTFFKYGKKDFPKNIRNSWFYAWSILGLAISSIIQVLFVFEFGLVLGGIYSAFIQNLIMSILFISMLVQRNSSLGQNQIIAVAKWIGTLAPTILFGFFGEDDIAPNKIALSLGIFCSIFDLLYIKMLYSVKKMEKSNKAINIII
jgi:hypothetical protein